jgi:CHAD domain-containing protein
VHGEVWRAYEEILAFELRQPADFAVVHQVRSACRRLRFTLEIFAGALDGANRVIEPMRELQGRLGELHDGVVAVECLERWKRARDLPTSAALEAYLARRVRVRDRLRSEFDREWRALTASPLRSVLCRTLGERRGPVPGPLRLMPAA